jgi:hypothetical protein
MSALVRVAPSRDNPGVSIPRDELQAAIEARRELGPEHEDELVEAFLARIERRLDTRTAVPARKSEDRQPFVISIVSLGVAVPLLGIGGGIAGLGGIVAVCLALVAVNAIVWSRR